MAAVVVVFNICWASVGSEAKLRQPKRIATHLPELGWTGRSVVWGELEEDQKSSAPRWWFHSPGAPHKDAADEGLWRSVQQPFDVDCFSKRPVGGDNYSRWTVWPLSDVTSRGPPTLGARRLISFRTAERIRNMPSPISFRSQFFGFLSSLYGPLSSLALFESQFSSSPS